MITITIDLDAENAPVYRRIADEIRARIACGELVQGAELPSVRVLGRQVGVNQNTVAKAYRVLADEGLVQLRHGACASVCRPELPQAGELDASRVEERRLRELVSRRVLAGESRRELERRFARMLDEFFSKGAITGGAG